MNVEIVISAALRVDVDGRDGSATFDFDGTGPQVVKRQSVKRHGYRQPGRQRVKEKDIPGTESYTQQGNAVTPDPFT